jgi:prepilin-type N-terminal cleavage/methylation domain-containing protein
LFSAETTKVKDMSMRSQNIRKEQLGQAGFSLIEAMVAVAIFAIGILGCYKMQLNSTHSNALAERVSTATNWATYAVEEILGKKYDHADLTDFANGTGALASAGLDDIEGNADGVIYIQPDGSKVTTASGSDLYSVSWNVVEGTAAETSVLRGVKQIRMHVVRKGGIGSGELYSHDYFKTEEI